MNPRADSLRWSLNVVVRENDKTRVDISITVVNDLIPLIYRVESRRLERIREWNVAVHRQS